MVRRLRRRRAGPAAALRAAHPPPPRPVRTAPTRAVGGGRGGNPVPYRLVVPLTGGPPHPTGAAAAARGVPELPADGPVPPAGGRPGRRRPPRPRPPPARSHIPRESGIPLPDPARRARCPSAGDPSRP
ncbi:hypothetical protein B5D80_16140 [Micromonospora wenchangensis]|uniref:Uncharacterized protein n=1 Tax=Micromonospora wenchangensis TaxID=1185415 RepID=A0A246RL02_9ACTN|nr:hypothetical protein B5D80_16140 [Micromonospora wenchangensis]